MPSIVQRNNLSSVVQCDTFVSSVVLSDTFVSSVVLSVLFYL